MVWKPSCTFGVAQDIVEFVGNVLALSAEDGYRCLKHIMPSTVFFEAEYGDSKLTDQLVPERDAYA